MANVTIKKYNSGVWDIIYPKTTIAQVINLSTSLANMQSDINGKAPSSHYHDDRYFTETEIANNAIYMRRLMLNANGVPTNNLGAPTVAEMALFQEQFNNKTEFYPIHSLTFETYDGSVWTDITSTISDTNKKRFFGGDSSASIVIPNGVVKYRITIRNVVSYVYLNALYMYWSGSGNSTKVHIWKKRDDGDWLQHTFSNDSISSWPGHMFLPFSTIPWLPSGGTTHQHLVRIEFTPTWSHATNGITLYKMQWWGGYPAGKRTIYSVDEDRVVTFPNTVKVGSNNVIVEGDARLSNARPASDVSAWAKAVTKPSYSYSEVGAAPTSHNHNAESINSGRLTLSRFPTGLDGTVLKGNGLNDPVWGSISWGEIQSKPSFAAVAVSGDYNDLSNKPSIPTNTWRGIDDVPVNGQTAESISSNWAYDHVNSSDAHPGYLKDAEVPAWAKEASKPSYVWSEIGSKPTSLLRQVSFSNGILVVELA
jgi:hypothetical protein